MRIRRLLTFLTLSLAVLFALRCASGGASGRPKDMPQPEIDAELANDIFFGSSRTAPATVDVDIQNKGAAPITIRRIELDSPSMTEWGFDRQTRDYREVVEPGATKQINFFANARTITTRRNEPLSYRLQIYFQSGEAQWREIVNIISTVPPR